MTHNTLRLQANCMTTAMGIMPHTNVEAALRLALSLDIPFWPQLPNASYYEDMYAQTSENFPGMSINTDEEKISFYTSAFESEVANYSQKIDLPPIVVPLLKLVLLAFIYVNILSTNRLTKN